MGHASQSPAGLRQRVVRVFVSSTFRDMHAERDELTKRVFPQLRKMCEERGVSFVDVDLRWGVTDEQKAEGKVLPICLQEIESCRPFFIGLLGERYGWVPDRIPPELIEREPWLAQHLGHSVTELEILHGVLNNPAMANRACFYFRTPAYLDRLPPDRRGDFIEEDPAKRAKLAALKERIRQSGLALREGYPDPPTLGRWVLRDLTAAINQEFPPGPPPDPLDREAAEHEAFARSRAGVYIGREEYFSRLEEHAAGDGPPLVLLGQSGSGKSALLANWALRYRAAHPERLIVMHFIGASPSSADWAAMLRRVMGELKRHFDIRQDIPSRPDALRQAFADWLHTAAARGRVVLILDALNQLEERDGAPDLVWLPPVVPANVRLIVSTLSGRPLDEIEKRTWPAMRIRPLEPDERRQLIVGYLDQYRKTLSREPADRIATSFQAANPLYLRTLLEELRQFGIHEKLDQRIDHYLEAQTVRELYEKMLQRYEQDYERDRPGLVRDAMTALWAARRGLSEAELLDILGSNGQPLPRAHWSPLYLAAEQSLVIRSGLIGFCHAYLREAVRRRYLLGETETQNAHRRLADYFDRAENSLRKLDELPWQLAESHAIQRLYELLADLPFFAAAWAVNRYEVQAYWAHVEACSSLRMTDAFRSVLAAPQRHTRYLWDLGLLLDHRGCHDEALSLHKHLSEHYDAVGDPEKMVSCLGNQAASLMGRGDMDEALELLGREEVLCRRLGLKDTLASCLGNQALILRRRDQAEKAMTLLREEESLCRELGSSDGLAQSLGIQAMILKDRGESGAAMALYDEAERLCIEAGNRRALQSVFRGQAEIRVEQGNFDAALSLFEKLEQLHRELGEKEGLGRALINQANLLHYDLRRPGMALEKCKQAAGVLRESAADSDALEQAEWLLDQIAK